ncbi:MAG: hypothetical protein PWQ96_1260 [Clostridia bacterium]|jgi:hypothetical protein|nr:hypothetical protein [Clostridiales bacterium]MDK2985618.1 hypothetical protein [Clostridia bacterium]
MIRKSSGGFNRRKNNISPVTGFNRYKTEYASKLTTDLKKINYPEFHLQTPVEDTGTRENDLI